MQKRLSLFALWCLTPLALLTSSPAEACAAKSVKIIVACPPGSADDAIARILAQKMSEAGGRFYVENLPGAGGDIGTAAAARAPADGCTVVVVNQNIVVQPLVKAKVPYDLFEGFAPITLLVAAPETISVHPSVPATTIQELIVLLKANPGKYSYASPGYGTSPHLAMERLFKLTLGLDVLHVPFQGGGPAVASMLGGHTQILHITMPLVAPLAIEGKLRMLAVADISRSSEFPDVPTLAEAGVANHEVGFWNGAMVPKGTPKAIVDDYHKQITRILSMPDVKARLAELRFVAISSSAEEFTAHLRSEGAKWDKVVREAQIKSN